MALEQAAAYILAKQVSFAAYLRSYQKRRLQLLEKEKPQVGDYPDSVATTWTINFEAVQASNPAAADLLRMSAFLAPDNIPYEILLLGKDHLGELLSAALAEAVEDELVIPELLEELSRYSLIRPEDNYCYSIHRMVQEVLRGTLTPEQRQQWIDRTINALNKTFPYPEFENWRWCDRLTEHVQAIDLRQATGTIELGQLLNTVGYFLEDQGRYAEAESLYLQALNINRVQLGPNHPSTATILSNLAGLYCAQGRYADGEPLLLQALRIIQSQLGQDHFDTARSLNNLAELYRTQGRYTEAEPLYIQALDITRTHVGPDHPSIATSLNNLALLYKSQGCYSEAEPLYLQALDIRRSKLGPDHPDTANSLNNLAGLYKSQGRYSEAEPLYLQALDIRRSKLGPDHPDTATSLNNLAALYYAQERYAEAESFFLQTLTVCIQCLGENHPNTQTGWENFIYFLQQVIEAGRAAELSNHPLTQALLMQMGAS